MPNVRQLRNRIKGIKNIQQITRAMKMVATARLHKAQNQLLQTRPYAQKLQSMLRDIAPRPGEVPHPLLRSYPGKMAAVVVITSDKGLCGGFNVQPLQHGSAWLLGQAGRPGGRILSVGKKAVDFFRRTGQKAVNEWAGFWLDLNWYHAEAISQELIKTYSSAQWSQVVLIYNRFKSMLTQELVEEILLPLPELAPGDPGRLREYEFEPPAREVYAQLLPRYVHISVWRALLESKAAELAARMQAMAGATDSAGDMIAEMTLQMNRIRQAAITREISELVGSAEAIAV